jgi:hypothetical protein
MYSYNNDRFNDLDVYAPLSQEIARQKRLFFARQRVRLAEIGVQPRAVGSKAQAQPITNRVVGELGRGLVSLGWALQRVAGNNKVSARP